MSDYIPNNYDLEEKAQGRIIWQYRNSPKFKAWVEILPRIGKREISDAANAVAGLINLDTATGEALNICGRIAQLERPVIPEPQPDDIFQLGEDDAQLGADDMQMISIDSAIPVDLQDDLYRRLIRAKISVNTSNATIDSIAETLAQVVGISLDSVRITDYQDMTYEVAFLEPLDSIIRYALTNYPLTPRPQGVRLRGYVEEPAYVQLGDEWQLGDDDAQLNEIYL